MSEINDGGPAFPLSDARGVPCDNLDELARLLSGMSLRDYFAAKAMQALMRPEYYEIDTVGGIDGIAGNAYDVADAMLKARQS